MGGFLVSAGRVVASMWLFSWFALYLEIIRYHHVSASRVTAVLSRSGGMSAQPGEFVRSVVACSLVAPIVFAVMWALLHLRRQRLRTVSAARIFTRSFSAWLPAVFGFTLVLLGVINQLLRHPPLVVDLTLRNGNGGFVVLGLLLATAAISRYTFSRQRT